eukprot:TRINITY_DN3788_c1_g1_i1.p1 TRINITY_DN3788_c1_g1~~TRINITY_DN3788_c1_g1_i1.p1  ORF type:complete len:171 (-),score=36.17 TRINITY_DN3788_c1_g1_i1:143-655(-)
MGSGESRDKEKNLKNPLGDEESEPEPANPTLELMVSPDLLVEIINKNTERNTPPPQPPVETPFERELRQSLVHNVPLEPNLNFPKSARNEMLSKQVEENERVLNDIKERTEKLERTVEEHMLNPKFVPLKEHCKNFESLATECVKKQTLLQCSQLLEQYNQCVNSKYYEI